MLPLQHPLSPPGSLHSLTPLLQALRPAPPSPEYQTLTDKMKSHDTMPDMIPPA